MSSNSGAFDLPIEEIKVYIDELMEQIGENITVDGVPTKAMLADLERAYSNLEQNMKRMVFLYDTKIKRGSKIIFNQDKIGIVYTVPNDDIVSLSADVVICNARPEVLRYEEVFDTNPNSPTYGDILSKSTVSKGYFDGFIERLTYREKQMDVGLLHDAILRFVTFQGVDIQLGDTFIYKGKKYRVIDLDDITDGILIIQLENLRS